MADQGKWFKLWCSSLNDPDLENLELENWARWSKLGTYIKEQGKEGKIRFHPPYHALLNLLRVPKIDVALGIIKQFPNVYVGERSCTVTPVTNGNVTYEIEYQNWHRYQGDFSNDRVRKFRDKKRHRVTAQEEKRGEERRREKNTPKSPQSEWFEKIWEEYPQKGRLRKKDAFKRFSSTVPNVETAKRCAVALEKYIESKRVKEGYVQNAPTWFGDWESWENYTEENQNGKKDWQ